MQQEMQLKPALIIELEGKATRKGEEILHVLKHSFPLIIGRDRQYPYTLTLNK